MKILITGFDPFGGETTNPATEVLKLLKAPEGVELLKKLNIPTVFGVGEAVCREILREKPDAVLLLGQAGGRKAITPERVAINLMDAAIPDNRGFQPTDLPLQEGGKTAYFSTLPIKKMVSYMEGAGVPAQVSNTAGTFVCNSLFYTVLSCLDRAHLRIPAGFVHVPFLPEQTLEKPQYPSLPLAEMVKGLEAALLAIRDDLLKNKDLPPV